MKQEKPTGYPKGEEHPEGTHPLPMTLATRAKRARKRRQRGTRGAWLNREPQPLGGSSRKGAS
jgi:hypothetical protein